MSTSWASLNPMTTSLIASPAMSATSPMPMSTRPVVCTVFDTGCTSRTSEPLAGGARRMQSDVRIPCADTR